MSKLFPQQCQVVVIGGGIIGCSTAYHLAKNGITDVVVIEKGKLTSGSTWHAAGLIGQLRSDANITQLLRYSVQLYDTLEQETGLATGWRGNGSLRLACNKDRRIEIQRQIATAKSFGLEINILTPSEVADLCPGIYVGDLDCGVFVPGDGTANPADLTQSLAKGARSQGARIFEDTAVTSFRIEDDRIAGVVTEQGAIACESAVICAGIWSREIGRMAGANIPVHPAHHHYVVTDRIEGLSQDMPSIRDPDRLTYFKEEVGGLVAGGYEFNPIAYQGIPSRQDPDFHLFPGEVDHLEPLFAGMMERFPGMESTGIKQWFNGLESFTEDTSFILGETPEVQGLFTGCGFNSMGIASGGGAGMALAYWVEHGEPPFDLFGVDIRRFSALHRSDRNVRTRALEGQAHHYAMHWPGFEFEANRPLRRSAIYDRLSAMGACFGGKSGWERPNWFAPEGVEAVDVGTFGRPNWFEHVGNEHRGCREKAALFDQSSFAKLLVTGPDAERALQRICAGNVGKPTGRLTYTQMLNSRGGVECDLTVTRLSENEFYIVTGTAMGIHDSSHIQRSLQSQEVVQIVDLTSAYGVLGLMGPKAREILQPLAEENLGNEHFSFAHARQVMIAGCPVLAMRLSFTGELGWELHVPTEYMLTVFDALQESGRPHGMVNAGYRAINSLRLEKGYLIWGADIGPDHTPLEAGVGFAVSFKKPFEFTGKRSLLEQKDSVLTKKLAAFTVKADNVTLIGRETIYRNGEVAGWLSSGGYGYTLECGVGMGYVRNPDGVTDDYLIQGEYELDVAGDLVPATIHLRGLYDPDNSKIRA